MLAAARWWVAAEVGAWMEVAALHLLSVRMVATTLLVRAALPMSRSSLPPWRPDPIREHRRIGVIDQPNSSVSAMASNSSMNSAPSATVGVVKASRAMARSVGT